MRHIFRHFFCDPTRLIPVLDLCPIKFLGGKEVHIHKMPVLTNLFEFLNYLK